MRRDWIETENGFGRRHGVVEIMNFIRILSRSEGRSGPFTSEIDVRDEIPG